MPPAVSTAGRSDLITQDNASDPAKAIGNVKMFKEQYHCKMIIAGVIIRDARTEILGG